MSKASQRKQSQKPKVSNPIQNHSPTLPAKIQLPPKPPTQRPGNNKPRLVQRAARKR